MKIKKALALIVTVALTAGTMAGCNQATLNYSKEIANTAKWEAVASDMKGSVSVDVLGTKEDIKFSGTGYSYKDKGYVEMKFNTISGEYRIPDIKEYIDGNTVYINKSYLEGVYALNGQPIPEGFYKINEEYIGIDYSSMGVDLNKIKALTTQPDAMIKLGNSLFGNSDIDVPFVKNGREYTIDLDTNQTVDLSAKALKAAANNLDNINNIFKLGLTSEMITEIKKSVNDESFENGLSDAKKTLDGSSITLKQAFTDTSCTGDVNINLRVKDMGKLSLTMKSTNTKSDVKEITLPASRIKLTMEELSKLSTPSDTTIGTTTNVIAK